MAHEVVVVGGGIGGLTVAALLAARGLDVCVLERQSRVGGCVAGFEKFGYTFDSGIGLYPLWQPDAIHDRVFSQLPVKPPETRVHDPAYVVRLPDRSEVALSGNIDQFEDSLRAVFPECATSAIEFYRESERVSNALMRAFQRIPDLQTAGRIKQFYSLLPHVLTAAQISSTKDQTVVRHLDGTSHRFRRFVDVQLQLLAQSPGDECAYLYATLALTLPRRQMFSIKGGSAALAAALAESIKTSGGRVRLDTPVLRLAYDASGRAIGVDLLSGETVRASRAIISNLTVWDTYGRLIGLSRTPPKIRNRLTTLRGWGAYVLYLGMDEAAAKRIPENNVLALTDWQEAQSFNPEESQFMFAAAPAWDTRGPAGKRAVTVHTFTDGDDWFTFHENEEQHEQKDQSKLEECWNRLHLAMPELGADLEVIDTATPQTCYDLTRRRLGMVGGVGQSLAVFGPNSVGTETSLPNVFMIGDTTFPGAGVAAVSYGALALANRLSARFSTT